MQAAAGHYIRRRNEAWQRENAEIAKWTREVREAGIQPE